MATINPMNLLNSPNTIWDYDIILNLCPYPKEIKQGIENILFISEDEVRSFLFENYKKDEIYPKLKNQGMGEESIRETIITSGLIFRSFCEKYLKRYQEDAILMCDLIDYIGHYPDTYPFPKPEELNPKLETLLEQYDIVIRYYLYDDTDKMQICGGDVVRVLNTLDRDIKRIRQLSQVTYLNKYDIDYDELAKAFEDVLKFPLSYHQQREESARANAMIYINSQRKIWEP